MTLVSRAILAATAAALLGSSAPAFALFDVQVLAGKRWYDFDNEDETYGVQSQEIDVAAHISPIPLVPIAFGAGVKLGDLRKEDLGGDDVSEAKVFEAGLEVYAWIPFVPIAKPYARLNFPLVANMAIEGKTEGATPGSTETLAVKKYDVSGFHVNAGLRFEPLPIVKFLVETGLGMQKYKIDEFKLAGSKQEVASKEYDLNSKTFMVGVEIGL